MHRRARDAVSPDSAAYLSAGRSLLEQRTLLKTDGSPFVEWPPLFPALLAVLRACHLDELSAVRFINSALLALVVALAGRAVRRWTGSEALALVTMAAVALGDSLVLTFSFAWSEPLFILLVTGFLVRAGAGTAWRWDLVVLAALACLTRYAGITLVATGVVLLLVDPARSLRRRLSTACGFAVLSVLPLALWLGRNVVVAGTLTGVRGRGVESPAEVAVAVAANMAAWVLPWQVILLVTASLPVALVVIAAVATCALVACARVRGPAGAGRAAIPAFLLLYGATLVALLSSSAADPVDARLVAPVFPAFVMAIVLSAHALYRRFETPARRGLPARAVVTVATVLLGFSIAQGSQRVVRLCATDGWQGFHAPVWQHSETAAAGREACGDERAITNFPEAVYFFAGCRVGQSPARVLYRSGTNGAAAQISQLAARLQGGTALFVWFSRDTRPFLLSPAELRQWFALTPLTQHRDGAVFRIARLR